MAVVKIYLKIKLPDEDQKQEFSEFLLDLQHLYTNEASLSDGEVIPKNGIDLNDFFFMLKKHFSYRFL